MSSTANNKGLNKKTVGRLVHTLSPYKKRLWLFGIITLLYCMSYVVFPRLLGSIFDIFSGSVISWILGIGDNSVFAEMIPYCIFALLFFASNSLFAFLQGHIISGVVTVYAFSLRSAVNNKFNRLTVKYIDSCNHKELIDIMTGVIDAVNQSLNLLFMKHLTSILLLPCIIIMQFLLNPRLGFISLIFCAVNIIYLILKQKSENKYALDEQRDASSLFDNAEDFFSGIEILKLSGKIDNATESLVELIAESAKRSEKSRNNQSLQKGINALLSGICIVAVTVAGVILADENIITIGILQCQLIYVRRLFSSVSELSLAPGICRTLLSSAETLFDFFDTPYTEKDESGIPLPSQKDGVIEFRDVSFRYDENSKQVLDGLSFKIPLKGITSLSGITGAGKTTVIKLLLGFYSPDKGRILYKGEDVSALNKKEYLSVFNIIVQGAGLFNDTIYNNIAYGSEGVSSDEIKAAAELSGADEVIKKLPNGYDTQFNPNQPNLSDGEIQLILLARAFLRKRDIIIFDEATSGIDISAEKKINNALNALAKNSAVIIIAHRASAFAGTNHQISLSDGKAKVQIF